MHIITTLRRRNVLELSRWKPMALAGLQGESLVAMLLLEIPAGKDLFDGSWTENYSSDK